MKRQAIRSITVMLSFLLLAAVPARANAVKFTDLVVRVSADGQSGSRTVDLRLPLLTQEQDGRGTITAKREAAANSGDGNRQSAKGPTQQADTSARGGGVGGSGASLTGTVLAQDGNVELLEVGEVTGTICDCGEIPLLPGAIIAGGGFPLFSLLGLAAVPLLFIGGNDGTPNPILPILSPTLQLQPATPTPLPPQIPEPATMFLFGTGLLALGAETRRRRRFRRFAQSAAAEIGEGEEA